MQEFRLNRGSEFFAQDKYGTRSRNAEKKSSRIYVRIWKIEDLFLRVNKIFIARVHLPVFLLSADSRVHRYTEKENTRVEKEIIFPRHELDISQVNVPSSQRT